MRHEHILGGCTPTPLAHYLKALGILRLVAEQKDPEVAGYWTAEQFVLKTVLAWEELEFFFLEEYRPSPIVAPWNGGSGFYFQEEKLKAVEADTGKRTKTGVRNQATEATRTVDLFLASKAVRLAFYREVLATSKKAVQEGGYLEAPKKEEKIRLVTMLRGQLPDASLYWCDAAILLGSQKADFPPLLGTGGNDGNLDFTNNFMQRLVELIDPDSGMPRPASANWLKGALSGQPTQGLVSRAIGQFFPGNAGGPNGTNGFVSNPLVNPWDYVLMLEGALFFAGSATRRMENPGHSALSCPFTVRMAEGGSGCLGAEQKARDEIWLPLWRLPANYAELQALFCEGRATVGRHSVRDGLDFARALSSYGVDRGIAAFQRYGFLMRSGKAYLATSLGKIPVRRVPEADLLTHLDRFDWLNRLRSFARSEQAPGRLRQLVRRLENAIFALTQLGGKQELQSILVLLGQVQQACALSAKGREAVPPVPLLGSDWALKADDQTHEFRIACALAGLDDMRRFLLPIKYDNGKYQWDPGNQHNLWMGSNLIHSLLRVLNHRLIEARRGSRDPGAIATPFSGFSQTDLPAVMAFLRAETDDTRIALLLNGLVNVRLPDSLQKRHALSTLPPSAYHVLKPLFMPERLLHDLAVLSPGVGISLPGEVISLLESGNTFQLERAVAIAWRRLRASGIRLPSHPGRPPSAINFDGPRLAAALMIPIAGREAQRMLVHYRPLAETAATSQE